ncbi:hypothetical protein [Halobacillus sp. B29]|uniref:hypothetical protein n=1 Tax=Halobacillus sp. B29 TaxID=3457432 RepID=UPI003FCC540A
MSAFEAWGEAGVNFINLSEEEIVQLRNKPDETIPVLMRKGKVKLNGTVFFPPENDDNDDLYEGHDTEIEGIFNPQDILDIGQRFPK